MSQVIGREALLFLIAAGQGAALLFLYDLLRGLRRAVLHGGIATAAEDLIYWAFAGIGTFALVFAENDGIFRGYILLGMGLGMVMYHYTVSTLVVRCTAFLLKWVLWTAGIPLRWAGWMAAKPVRAVHFLKQKTSTVIFDKICRKKKKKLVEKEKKSS